jgi:hypothetical protein
MVPYRAPTADGASPPTWQVLRINTHAGLHYHLKHLQQRYPHVDFVLIEPRPDDATLLSVNPMQYPLARDLIGHSCDTVAADLECRQAELAPVLARHDLRALDGPRRDAASGHTARRIAGRLAHTLADLQYALDGHGAGQPPAVVDTSDTA